MLLRYLISCCCLPFAIGQQIYVTKAGPIARPQCTAAANVISPTFSFAPFNYTLQETVRTATSVKPATTTLTYASPYSVLSTLLPNISTTSWGSWNPNATIKAKDTANPFGHASWTALWERANITNFTSWHGLYSTTVSPTPIPTSELILPPADPFGPTDCYYFPEDFIFGVSGSASQIEGAVADQGRTPTLMEVLVQDDRPRDYTTNENYYLYKQDIERIAAMGVKYYAFTISWTRILPFALPGTPVNQPGLQHYDDVINEVLKHGMIPAVTIFHFETPLQFFGNLSTTVSRKLPLRTHLLTTSRRMMRRSAMSMAAIKTTRLKTRSSIMVKFS